MAVSKRIFVSNWRLHDSEETIQEFLNKIGTDPKFANQTCFLALPYVYLEHFAPKYNKPQIIFGCNQMNDVSEGSFTKTIAGEMLKSSGAKFVIIGSSDNREYFKETNASINLKIHSALESGLQPILAIGETWQQYQYGQTEKVLAEQLAEGLKGLSPDDLQKVIVLFEAPWLNVSAIRPDDETLMKTYGLYHQIMDRVLGADAAKNTQVIYGFPNDLKDIGHLVEKVEANGFYTSSADFVTHLLDLHVLMESKVAETAAEEAYKLQPPVEALAAIAVPLSLEKKEISAPTIEREAEKVQEISAEAKEPESAAPSPQKEAVIPEAMEAVPPTPVSQVEQPAAQMAPAETEEEPVEAGMASPAPAEAKAAPVASVPDGELEEIAAVAGEGSEEDLEELIEEAVPENAEVEKSELEELNERLQQLTKKDHAIAESYASMHQQAAILPQVRKDFDPLMEKMLSHIDRLPADIQTAIRQGDVSFFEANEAKLNMAREVLLEIKQLNEMLDKISSVPLHIDRLKAKSREIRTELQKDWAYFNANRQSIKEKFPDFEFPATPKQLAQAEPEIDLTAGVMPPPKFPLSGKHLAIVNMKLK